MANNTDLTRLVFEIEQRGAAEAERGFRAVENGIRATLDGYRSFNLASSSSAAQLQANFRGTESTLRDLERSMATTRSTFGNMFSQSTTRAQEQRLRSLRTELASIEAQAAGGPMTSALQTRLADIQRAIDAEVGSTTRLFQQHQEEFNRLANQERRTLADLTSGLVQGGAAGIQNLRQGNIQGVGQGMGAGIQNLGQMAGGRAASMINAGGGGAMSNALMAFSRLAGPLALLAGAIGGLIQLFLEFDAKIKETNKTLLQNVSLTDLARRNYGELGAQVVDGTAALQDFTKMALTNTGLRNLGMDPAGMADTLGVLEQQGMRLKDLRADNVKYESALETAQVAALNLGVEASDVAGLMGQLGEMTGASFEQARDTLTEVVRYAKEAGVSSKRFFEVIQGTIGEMGLYNFRLEQSAALFSKLTKAMDPQSAQEFLTSISSGMKQMGATERLTTVALVGTRKVGKQLEYSINSAISRLDKGALQKAFSDLNLNFTGDLAKDLKGLTEEQSNMLFSVMAQSDEQEAQKLQKVLRMSKVDKNNIMELQGALQDLNIFDVLGNNIASLEARLGGMDISNMNSVLTQSLGVDEDQLRMLQNIKATGEGDLARLKAQTKDAKAFEEMAVKLGYMVKLDEKGNIVSAATGDKINTFTDLMRTMDERRQEDVLKDGQAQKKAAEDRAALTRTLLDTLQYKLLDLVGGIYSTLIDLYHAFVDKWGSDDAKASAQIAKGAADSQMAITELTRQQREIAQSGDPNAQARIDVITEKIKGLEADRDVFTKARRLVGGDSNITSSEALGMARLGMDDVGAFRKQNADVAGKIAQVNPNYIEQSTFGKYFFGDMKAYDSLEKEVISSIMPYLPESIQKGQKDNELRRAQSVFGGMAAEEVQAILEDGQVTNDELLSVQDRMFKHMTVHGEKFSDETIREQAKAIVDAQLKANFEQALREHDGPVSQDVYNELAKKYGQPVYSAPARKAGDARILTSGVPFLNLSAGDMVIDKDSLARTVAGRKGEFVPEFLSAVASKAGGAGGRGGASVLNANINIHGGDPQKVRETVLRVLEQWERQRAMA